MELELTLTICEVGWFQGLLWIQSSECCSQYSVTVFAIFPCCGGESLLSTWRDLESGDTPLLVSLRISLG